MLDIRVLGELAAAVDGRPVELPADARARELLARLALAPGPHSRSALAGRLRPDVAEESARKTLRNALYELRRALGPGADDALEVTAQRVALTGAARVDLAEFRRLVAAGELEAAADAGAGELLAGFDGEWALQARDEHAAEVAGVLAALTARAEAAGDLPAAAAWARRRVLADPLAEAAHRELIRLLALAGDRPAALAAARTAGERLRAELGIAPSAATRELVDAVRQGRIAPPSAPAPAAGAPPLPPALAAAERPEGRDAALARLEDAWAGARTGALRFALATGEPGIGKSTLAAELARRAHASGGAVLLGRTPEHALVPFAPWIEALEQLLAALAPADADRWLTEHDGALARLLPARSAAQAPAASARERYLAFELACALLEDVAAHRPVLLVLDDVHWADADSLALLRHLARAAPRARLLVLLCSRVTEIGPALQEALADLRREGPLVHVDLGGLDDDAVAALVARRTGAADAELARRLRARSGGNPFFLTELLSELEDGGDATSGPPAGVRDVVARRLARLEPGTLRTLDVAAVCGTAFDVGTVARVEDRSVVEVLEALDGATAAALVTDAGDGHHAFAHALVGETILAALPPSRRARLHLAVADVLEAHPGPRAGELARHLAGAGALAEPERLARWEVVAAREATAALAHAEAAAHLEAALAARRDAPDAERAELLLALGDARDREGRRDRARAAFLEAAALARPTRDPDVLARAALGHGGVALVIDRADATSVRLLEEAFLAAPAGQPARSARLLARLSVELYYSDRARARQYSALAVEQGRRSGDPAALAAALNAHRVALWTPAQVHERLAVAGDMLAAAESAGDREAQLQARNWRVVDLLELGRVGEAVAEIGAYEKLADAVALPHFRWYVPLWRGTLALLAGRWAESERLADEALAIGQEAEDPNAALFVGIQRSHRLSAQRRIGEIDRERIVRGAAASAVPTEWLISLAYVDARTGAIDQARPLVAQLAADGGRALAMDVNWHGACILGEAAVLVGDRDAAATVHALLEPHAALFPLIARAVACLGSCEVHLGHLAGFLGNQDEAEARLRRAVAEDDRTGSRPSATVARLRLGEVLTARGDADAAREVLQQARAEAEALEMASVAADAGRLL